LRTLAYIAPFCIHFCLFFYKLAGFTEQYLHSFLSPNFAAHPRHLDVNKATKYKAKALGCKPKVKAKGKISIKVKAKAED